jgi:hypothetical protein
LTQNIDINSYPLGGAVLSIKHDPAGLVFLQKTGPSNCRFKMTFQNSKSAPTKKDFLFFAAKIVKRKNHIY